METLTLRSESTGFSDGVFSVSSVSTTVSSISVPSVPLDDGAIGDGSAMSLGLEAIGDVWFGCRY